MVTSTEAVCEIQGCVVLRLIFGFYTDIPVSSRVRRVIKLYCYVIPFVLFGATWCCCSGKTRTSVLFTTEYIKFFSFYLFSFLTANNYIGEYLNYYDVIDRITPSKRIFVSLQKVVTRSVATIATGLTMHLTVQFAMSLKFCVNCGIAGKIIVHVFKFAIELGRFPLLLIFSLLYCHVKIFTKALRNDGFLSRVREHENKYLNAYTSIRRRFIATDYPVKCMVFINVVTNFVYSLNVCYLIIDAIKRKGFDNAKSVSLVMIMLLSFILDYVITYLPAIIMGLVKEELEKAKNFVADQLLGCTDYEKKKEMELLMMFLQKLPLEYSFCNAIKVNASLPLKALLVMLNYMVSWLQLTNFFAPTNQQVQVLNATHVNTTYGNATY